MSDPIRTEQERKDAERDALIQGLAQEVIRQGEQLDHCRDQLGEVIMLMRKLENTQRRLKRGIRTGHQFPPGLANGHDD